MCFRFPGRVPNLLWSIGMLWPLNGNNVIVQSTHSSTIATVIGANSILAPGRLRDTNSTLSDLCHRQRTQPGRLDSWRDRASFTVPSELERRHATCRPAARPCRTSSWGI